MGHRQTAQGRVLGSRGSEGASSSCLTPKPQGSLFRACRGFTQQVTPSRPVCPSQREAKNVPLVPLKGSLVAVPGSFPHVWLQPPPRPLRTVGFWFVDQWLAVPVPWAACAVGSPSGPGGSGWPSQSQERGPGLYSGQRPAGRRGGGCVREGCSGTLRDEQGL